MLFSTTNANNVPSFAVMAGFVLLILTVYYIVYSLIGLLGLYGIKIKHKRQPAIYLTAMAGLLIALQSTGELGTRDIWVLLPLVVMGYFYSTYARSSNP